MKSFKVSKSGIPILNADDIEAKAEEVISYFDKNILDKPQPTPLKNFVEQFHNKYKIEYDYSQNLGTTKYGSNILGKTKLKPLGIYIDSSLENDTRFNFVLGHELGHVVLHRRIDIKRTGYEEQELIDTKIDLVTGKKNLRTARDWIEWQANYFSSAILMPLASIIKAVVTKQVEMGIKRNIGRIFLEARKDTVRDYRIIRQHLESVFNVNATNIECRLKDLRILIYRMNINVKHISEIFTTEKIQKEKMKTKKKKVAEKEGE